MRRVILVLSQAIMRRQDKNPSKWRRTSKGVRSKAWNLPALRPTVYQVAETEKTILFVARDWVGVCVASTIIERGCRSLGGIIGSV